jgi:hypothetical protein
MNPRRGTAGWSQDQPVRGLERRGGVAGLVLDGQGGGKPRPGTLQPLQADGREALAAFPQLERFLQGEPAALQPPDHLDELVACLLVGHLGGGQVRAGLITRGLVTTGPASGGLASGGPVTGWLPAGRLAAPRANAALRLTRLGGHGANLAGRRHAMPGQPPGPGLHAFRGTEAALGRVAWTAAATTPA